MIKSQSKKIIWTNFYHAKRIYYKNAAKDEKDGAKKMIRMHEIERSWMCTVFKTVAKVDTHLRSTNIEVDGPTIK